MNRPRGAVKRTCGCRGLLIPVGLALIFGVAASGTARAQRASHSGQGSGISITLKKSFIDEYADRRTMVTDFIVDRALATPTRRRRTASCTSQAGRPRPSSRPSPS